MSITQKMLYYIPSGLLGFLIVISAIIISVAGVLLMRKVVGHRQLKTHNDIAGAIFSTLGVAYAVLLAFVVIVVWQNFDRSRINVEEEANCLLDLRADTRALDPSLRSDVHLLTGEYAQAVIDDEWKKIARGETSRRANRAVRRLFARCSAYEPVTEREKIFFTETVQKLNRLIELRRNRILDARNGLNSVMWFVLLVGATATIMFASFFGSEHIKSQIVMTSLLSIVISLILFLILVFDYPFTGDVQISPEAFRPMLQITEEGIWQKR